MDNNQNSQLILYQTEDGETQIQVIMQDETVWLTQKEMADLFQRDQSVISRHVNNVFKEGELDEESNMQKMHIANSDKPVAFYNLDVIISVGYRVKSHRGTQFRIWATGTLREYLVKGFCSTMSAWKVMSATTLMNWWNGYAGFGHPKNSSIAKY